MQYFSHCCDYTTRGQASTQNLFYEDITPSGLLGVDLLYILFAQQCPFSLVSQ